MQTRPVSAASPNDAELNTEFGSKATGTCFKLGKMSLRRHPNERIASCVDLPWPNYCKPSCKKMPILKEPACPFIDWMKTVLLVRPLSQIWRTVRFTTISPMRDLAKGRRLY